jgi:hypothetical protein
MKKFTVALFFMIVLASCARLVDATQTAFPTLTVAQSKTSESSQIPTELPTLTLLPSKTNIPTVTPTFTPIPPGRVLFQKDFEDGRMGEWQQIDEGGIWTVEQDPDGNHSLCGTGPSVNPPQIWYRDRRTIWTDYAFETRIKFIQGNTLYIIYRNDLGSNTHYGVALNDYGLSLMHTWSMIGRNFPMLPYPDQWYFFKVEIKGDSLSLYLDNLLFEELTLQPPVTKQGGIGYVTDAAGKVCLDDIKVWSLK